MNAKRLLFSSLLIATLVGNGFADDIVVYKGTSNESIITAGQTAKVQVGEYLLIDFTTSQLIFIDLTKVAKEKNFSVGTPTSIQKLNPLDDHKPSKTKQYTVLVAAKTTPNIPLFGGNTNGTEFDVTLLRGLNVTMTIGATSKMLPKVFTGTVTQILTAGTISSGPNAGGGFSDADVESKGVWSLQKSLTSEVETNNGTLDDAVNLVKALLINAGYVEEN